MRRIQSIAVYTTWPSKRKTSLWVFGGWQLGIESSQEPKSFFEMTFRSLDGRPLLSKTLMLCLESVDLVSPSYCSPSKPTNPTLAEYAAAFFLLAGNLQDAVGVCAHQMQDLQLAIAVARVYDGDDSLVLRSLLEDKVLPQAALEGNRWLATWAFWMLGRRDMAVRVLISPVYTLISSPETPKLQSKSYLSSDPALVVLYKQLREKTLQTLKGASKISPRAEWEFVIQNARLYDRMGCDLLALDLVRNWEFLEQPKEETTTNGSRHPPDPRMMLRRRSSLVVDDMPSLKSQTEQKMKAVGKPAPTVFEEPDTNSLLDSFGF